MFDVSNREWAAVVRRDRSADGRFVYAVTSTGIFCRPSCPSRRPRRERVECFPTPLAARAHGYRACLRCHPEGASTVDPVADRLHRVCRALVAQPDRRWTSAALATVGQCTPAHLRRTFKTVLGVRPRDYVAIVRRRALLSGLRRGASVTRAMQDAGYGSPSRVYGGMRLPGMTLASYARGGRGAAINWMTTASPLGRVLVAATAMGLCFVEVGPSDEWLRRTLRAEFPHAQIAAKPHADMRPWAELVRRLAVGAPVARDLAVDIRGTAFQWRVWRALTAIPPGETRTYAQLARAIGQARAVRAVARACATNPVALVVPCHRVIGSDGDLRGFRWGVEVKRKLLVAEGARSFRV